MSVLIIGAGPTGLMLAIWLKVLRPTIELRVVDKASGPGTTSRAIVIHARTLEFYDQLGFADRIVAEGKIIEGIDIVSSGAVKGSLKFGKVGGHTTKFPFVLALAQDKHENLLVQYLHELGGRVEWNTEVTSLVQTEETVRVSLSSGEAVEVDYVAGCDGSHSEVRNQLGLSMEGSRYPARFFVADTVVSSASPVARQRICLSSTSLAVSMPLGADRGSGQNVRVLGLIPSGCGETEGFESFRQQIEEISGYSFDEVKWSSTYNVHHRVASRFRDRRVFLLGDAAHVHSPVGGQGMNTGLGDASNLAWKLNSVLDNKTDDAILDTYEIERRSFALQLVRSTDVIFHLVIRGGILGFLFRKIFMARIVPLLWTFPSVPQRVFRMASQLGVSYRQSPLSQGQNQDNLDKLQAGDRLPWTGAAGVDNHAALRERRFQIHQYSETQADRTEARGLPVRTFSVKNPEQFDLKPGFDYLVRPDGYITSISSQEYRDLSHV